MLLKCTSPLSAQRYNVSKEKYDVFKPSSSLVPEIPNSEHESKRGFHLTSVLVYLVQSATAYPCTLDEKHSQTHRDNTNRQIYTLKNTYGQERL